MGRLDHLTDDEWFQHHGLPTTDEWFHPAAIAARAQAVRARWEAAYRLRLAAIRRQRAALES